MIDILNDKGEVVGTLPRGLAEYDNHMTENVLVFVFNASGEVWVQLRSQRKKHYPGKWDISACGAVISGEPHQEAARRETFEEMGIEVELRYIESFLNVFSGDNSETRKRLSHLYLGMSNQLPQANDEVDDFKIWQPQALKADVVNYPETYVPSFLTEFNKAMKGYGNLKQSTK